MSHILVLPKGFKAHQERGIGAKYGGHVLRQQQILVALGKIEVDGLSKSHLCRTQFIKL